MSANGMARPCSAARHGHPNALRGKTKIFYGPPVCTENLIRIDCVTESPNVNGDDRALFLSLTLTVSPFKSKSRLEAENAALRHQLIVLQRRVRGRVQLTNGDRLFLVL